MQANSKNGGSFVIRNHLIDKAKQIENVNITSNTSNYEIVSNRSITSPTQVKLCEDSDRVEEEDKEMSDNEEPEFVNQNIL